MQSLAMNRRAKMKLVAGLAKNPKTLPTAMALAKKLRPKASASKRSASSSSSVQAARPSKHNGTKETPRVKGPTLSKLTDSARLFVITEQRANLFAKRLRIDPHLIVSNIVWLQNLKHGQSAWVGKRLFINTNAGLMWVVDAVRCGQLAIPKTLSAAKEVLKDKPVGRVFFPANYQIQFVQTTNGIAILDEALVEGWVNEGNLSYP